MNETTTELNKSRINHMVNVRGKYALQISYTEVLDEFFDIVESSSVKISDFSEDDISDMLDAVEFASVDGFLRKIIFSLLQARL